MPNHEFIEDQQALNEILERSITAGELAAELGVAIPTVYRWLQTQKDIPVIYVPVGPRRKTPLFPVPEIYAWFEEHEASRRGPR